MRALQERINASRRSRGLPPISEDGVYGPGTAAALRESGIADSSPGDSRGLVGAIRGEEAGRGRARAETFAATPPGSVTAASRRQLAAWAAVPGETSATAMRANGGRPVVVHVSPGFDPTRPAKVVTFLHGHGWDVGPSLAQRGVLERVQALATADPQTVFVFPQAGSPPFHSWFKAPGESYTQMEAQALGEAARLVGAERITVGQRIVDAHSGGGVALANVANAGELKADKVNLIDSAYGSWAQAVGRWAARAPHRPRVESWYTNHASQAANNAAAARLAPGQFTTHAAGSLSQHNALPRRVLGSN